MSSRKVSPKDTVIDIKNDVIDVSGKKTLTRLEEKNVALQKEAEKVEKKVTELAAGASDAVGQGKQLKKQLSKKAAKKKIKKLADLSLSAVQKPNCGQSLKLLMGSFTGSSAYFRKKADEFACRTNNNAMQAQALLTNVQNIQLTRSAKDARNTAMAFKAAMVVSEKLWICSLETIIEFAPYLALAGAKEFLDEYVEMFGQLVEDAESGISKGAADGNVAAKNVELLLTYCTRFTELQRFMWATCTKVEGFPGKVFTIIIGTVHIGATLSILGITM